MTAKTPKIFVRYINNEQKKTKLIHLIGKFIAKDTQKAFIKSKQMYFPAKGCCLLMNETELRENGLRSNQDNTNKKLIINCTDSPRVSEGNVLHSLSGDEDIIVLAVSLIRHGREHLLLEYASANKISFKLKMKMHNEARKIYWSIQWV